MAAGRARAILGGSAQSSAWRRVPPSSPTKCTTPRSVLLPAALRSAQGPPSAAWPRAPTVK
jgi:hypothetical protein